MPRRYATADVFTAEPLGGNPVAVVLDAEGLTTAQMQALAAEFNYVETTFVLPPLTPGTPRMYGSSPPIARCRSPGTPISERRSCSRGSGS